MNPMRFFDKIRYELFLYKKFVWFAHSDDKVSILYKIKWAIRGWSVAETKMFDFNHNDYRGYLSDRERMKSRYIINHPHYVAVLDNKLLFEEVFGKYVKVPTNYAYISSSGFIYGLNGFDITKENIIDFIKQKGDIILKYLNGSGGVGVHHISSCGDTFKDNNKNISLTEVLALLDVGREAIICEYIQQGHFTSSLFPHTANTIRIICGKEKNKERNKIYIAVQRIGTKDTVPVDNVHSGGLCANINLETGMLSAAIALQGPKYRRNKEFRNHPDTNAPIEGVVIPNWGRIKEDLLILSNKLPYFNFIAWDVLLLNDGICILEGNASSSTDIIQGQGGERNTSYGELYRSYGIIN